MANLAENTSNETNVELSELDAMLNEIQGADAEVAEPVESTEPVDIASLSEEDIAKAVAATEADELDAEIAESEAASPAEVATDFEVEAVKAQPADTVEDVKPKKAKKASTRTAASKVPSEAIKAIIPGSFALQASDMDIAGVGLVELNKERMDKFDVAAVKVKEKIINAFKWYCDAATLSKYTALAIKFLVEKESVTSAEMVAMYVGTYLGESTGRAQTSQMMLLLPLLCVAKREGNRLTLNEESMLVAQYKSEQQ